MGSVTVTTVRGGMCSDLATDMVSSFTQKVGLWAGCRFDLSAEVAALGSVFGLVLLAGVGIAVVGMWLER